MISGNTDSFLHEARRELTTTENGRNTLKCAAKANGIVSEMK